jgi:competence protein ComEA
VFTPDELRALSLLLVLVALGACLRLVEAQHPRFLTLTLGDSLALGADPGPATPAEPDPGIAIPNAPSNAPGAPETVFPGTSPTDSAAAKNPAFGLDGRLDLNRASADDLEGLPGIGPKTALRILDDRRQHGRFRRPADLGRVKGIGPKTLARLLPLVTVRAARDSA